MQQAIMNAAKEKLGDNQVNSHPGGDLGPKSKEQVCLCPRFTC
jgi:hypothetical protein